MGIITYNEEQLNLMRQSGKILSGCLSVLKAAIKPGISTLELDQMAEKYIRDNGGEPSFKGYSGYEFSICTSVNEGAIHCRPSADKILREGDIITVDIGVRFGGMCTDAARTWGVGKISDEAQRLINATEQCFTEAIRGLKAMSKVGDIGARIEKYITENTTYSIIEQYCGHGIGEKPHQDPLIPNFVPRKILGSGRLRESTRMRLPAGCAIAIEPMINEGVKEVVLDADRWSTRTADGKLSCHYENTLIILDDGVEVVTVDN